MRVAIAGATGLIGSAVAEHLRSRGHTVVRLVRRDPEQPDDRRWDPPSRTIEGPGLADVEAVVNFAGAGIADFRWTDAYRRRLRSSRLASTQAIVRALREAPDCRVLLNGSAVGYYGDRGPMLLDEDSSRGHGFLAQLCLDWEREATAAPDHVRVVRLRTGHVLSPRGGILGKQRLAYQLGAGGRMGSGEQYVSWISMDDYVRAVELLLERPVSGPVDLTAPNPVTQATFARAFARALHRPAVVPMPMPLVKAVFTPEMVRETMLASQRALPRVLTDQGFTFVHERVDDAMAAVQQQRRG